MKHYFGNNLYNKTFAVWRLSFKPNTNDMCEASSGVLIESLCKEGVKIQAFNSKAMKEAERIYGNHNNLKFMNTKEETLIHADGLVICTEWQNFHTPNFKTIKNILKQPVIFDGRNLYDPKKMNEYGFVYYAIGRGISIHAR
ncbi:UDP binding domain-containing protein [Pantoea sp. Mhis]|uniref:UDP binding domain-containing protein n=1 Tax=Pantoea sp. Mhis TaxID=2576759 RepID=UPI00351BB42E